MHTEAPLTGATHRRVRCGGASKALLLQQLRAAGVELNALAQALFQHDGFTTSENETWLHTTETSVAGLGCDGGATLPEILVAGRRWGLQPAPLELAVHLRLQFLDQAEGHLGQPATQHRAPPGSLTVVSPPVVADDEIPKGFYLRRIDGVLWLRAYRSDAAHVWSPADQLLFLAPPGPR